MALGYKFYRDSWIKLALLTVGLGAMLWGIANGETRAEPGVVPLIIGIAVAGHAFLLIMMFRAKKKEAAERQAALLATLQPASPSQALASDLNKGENGFMNRELSPRGIGGVMIICGLGLAYLSVVMPISDAAAHSASVSISLKGSFIVPFVLLSGLLYAIFPVHMTRFAGHPQQPERRAWLLYIPLLLLGALLYLYVKSTVESYGYTFR